MTGPATGGAPPAADDPRTAPPPSALHVLTRPRMLLLHGAAVLAVLAAWWLGQWQLGAWQQHREETGSTLASAAPRPLDSVLGPDDAFPKDDVGRPVSAQGRWLPDRTVYVDGRDHAGRSGAWQVTPLVVCGAGVRCASASALLVVVGWTPDPAAAPPPPHGGVDVTGWLQPSEQPSDQAPGEAPRRAGGVDVVPSLQVSELLDRVDHDLYSGYLILDRPASARAGLAPVTPDSLPKPPASTALRNLLYGIQWWIFGGFAVFLWWRWCRDELTARRAPSEARLPSGG